MAAKDRKARQVLVGCRLVEALRDVLEGVIAHVREQHRRWHVRCVDADEFAAILGQNPPDGAIAVIAATRADLLETVARANVPMVNMFHDVHPALPSVLADDPATGRAAAQFLLARGHRHFAYVGFAAAWSVRRQRGFADALAEAGRGCHAYAPVTAMTHYRFLEKPRAARMTIAWIRRLPKPLAVLACTDEVASTLLELLVAADVRVPDDVAVVGVGNLVATCELAPVAITSVSMDFPAMGYHAARLLDGLMTGARPPNAPLLVAPGSVVPRRSTDAFMFEDEHVRAAMQLIHERAMEGLSMKELLQRVPVSRKWLDLRFKAVVGHTASIEMRRLRLERVRELLVSTDFTVPQIARLCSFSHAENLIRFFRDGYGSPPIAFRAKHRSRG